MSEIDEATDRVLMGPAKVTKKYTEKEKKLVAYHEAGHAVEFDFGEEAGYVQEMLEKIKACGIYPIICLGVF